MNVQVRTTTPEAEETLEALAEELEIPQHRYEDAERSYKSLGDWLNRENSSIRQYEPQVHVQGSFGLGTVIPPIADDEHYDVDAVCEFRKLTKGQLSQQKLKRLLGDEIKLYAASQNMKRPVEERRRCWMLVYADGAQFHMDVTPGIPNATEQRARLAKRGLDAAFADTAIAITDTDHQHYEVISDEWPRSNPRGYLKWFQVCMAKERNKALKRGFAMDSTEPIPDYKVRTPLQRAIMILKRHRDITFIDRFDERPISVILTTLAAHAYDGETKIADALFAILSQMDRFKTSLRTETACSTPSGAPPPPGRPPRPTSPSARPACTSMRPGSSGTSCTGPACLCRGSARPTMGPRTSSRLRTSMPSSTGCWTAPRR
jgi:hypothetical protein